MNREIPLVFMQVVPEGASEAERIDVTETLLSFEYEDVEDGADKLKFDVRNDQLAEFDNPLWKKGNLLFVTWGYPGAMAPPRKAVIEKIGGFDRLSVEAHALSMVMNTVSRRRQWEQRTRSEVASEIASEWGYGPEMQVIEATTQRFETITQTAVPDARFLKALARKQGFVFFVDFDGFHFHSRQTTQRTHRTYTYFTDPGRGEVLSVSVENDVTAKKTVVIAVGENPETKEPIIPPTYENWVEHHRDSWGARRGWGNPEPEVTYEEWSAQHQDSWGARRGWGSTSDPIAPVQELPQEPPPEAESASYETWRAQHGSSWGARAGWSESVSRLGSEEVVQTTATTPEEAETQARAVQTRTQLTAVKLKMDIIGDPTLLAKTMIEVRGISRRLSGPYYVPSVRHKVLPAPYVCALELRSDGTRGYGDPQFPEVTRERAREAVGQEDETGIFGSDWEFTMPLPRTARVTPEGEDYETFNPDGSGRTMRVAQTPEYAAWREGQTDSWAARRGWGSP